MRAALAARLNCHDPRTPAEQERCGGLVADAPEMQVRETRGYFRMREHVAVMAEVRRRENIAPRLSCETMRNLSASCPNLLPDNLPKDFEIPD